MFHIQDYFKLNLETGLTVSHSPFDGIYIDDKFEAVSESLC